MRRSILALILLASALPSAASAQDLSGRYDLRGLRGWLGATRASLVVRRTAAADYVVERRSGGAVLRGVGVQSGRRLRVTFPARVGAAGSLGGASARPTRGDYRVVGRWIGGTLTTPSATIREAGRRTGSAPRPPTVTRAIVRTPANLRGRLRVVGPALKDPWGRAVVLRGVNAGKKSAPFLPAHDAAAVQALVDATGVNLVRLYVAWRAIEPAPGRIDAAHLAAIKAKVAAWTAAGVYVLVDMHQDVWGGATARHGAPTWATLARNRPALTLPAGAPWQARYLDERVYGSFEALWANRPVAATGRGLQEHSAFAWAALAQTLAAEDRIVGYDLLNEPFFGDGIRRGLVDVAWRAIPTAAGASLLPAARALIRGEQVGPAVLTGLLRTARTPRVYEALVGALGPATARMERRLSAYYARVGRAIRAVDPGRPLFLEPMALAGVGVPSALPHPGLSQIVYAPHLYDAFVDSGQPYDGDVRRVARTLAKHQATAHRLGAPLLIGEWGHINPSSGNPHGFARDMSALIDGANVGSAYWEHRPGDETSPIFQSTVRPYARRTAGRLTSTTFDPATRRLRIELQADARIAAPTVITTPQTLYPAGVRVTLSGVQAESEHDPTANHVRVWAGASGGLTITVTPR